MRLLLVGIVALLALATGSEGGTFPAPDGECPTAEEAAGLCTTLRGFVIEPHAVYPRVENVGGIPHKFYTLRVTPKGAAGGCTSSASRFAITFESPIVPGSCQPLPQKSLFTCTGGCSTELTQGLEGQAGFGEMAKNLRSIDVMKFTKTLSCSGAPIDLTLVFTSTDTSERALDVGIADVGVVTSVTAIGMIPGPFCAPPQPELNIISTKYEIEGKGTFTVFFDGTGRVVEVRDVNGIIVDGIPVTETYKCLPANNGDCPTSDAASFCTTPAGGGELLCSKVQAVIGELVEKAGAETVCTKTIGGKVYRVC